MTVGDVRTVARIRERKQAAREFEAAKRDGKSASLLEQSRPNVFTMKIANVLPGDTIVGGAQIHGAARADRRRVRVRVPDRRRTALLREARKPGVARRRVRHGSVHAPGRGAAQRVPPLRAWCRPACRSRSSRRPRISWMSARPVRGARRWRLPSPSDSRAIATSSFATDWPAQEIASGLLLYQGRDENFFLLMAEPPQVVQPDEVPSREYIFVLDVSGSMNGFPLDTAKKLMGDLANVLRPSDTFNIVVFADGSDTFSPASVPATRPNLTRALQFIGRKNGGGGTRLLAALERAVAIPRQPGVSRSIVLVTDGYIEAESDVFDYVRAQLDDVNFFAFGIGSSVNRFLIEGVARAGLGEPFIVTEPAEAAEAAARLRRYIDTPVLTGIDVTFSGIRRLRCRAGEGPGPVRQPPDRRLRQVARQRRLDRSRSRAGPVAGAYHGIDCRLAGERRHASRCASASVGANPHRRPVGFRSQRSERGARRRDHLAGADLWLAHAIHVVRGGAGDRAAHH